MRHDNLTREVQEIRQYMRTLEARAKDDRARGNAHLALATEKWRRVETRRDRGAVAVRQAAATPPRILSLEVLSVGFGESLILHYGDPDAPQFILIDTGRGPTFEAKIKPRFEDLKQRWSPNAPLPIKLCIVTNQDDDRIGGLQKMLKWILAQRSEGAVAPYALQGVWYNSFAPAFPDWQKAAVRLGIEALGIPLNRPFDHLVARADSGRVDVDLGQGLTATILNPSLASLRKLHELWAREAHRRGHPARSFPDEKFRAISIRARPEGSGAARWRGESTPRPGDLGGYIDRSVPNLASTVVLYELGGRRFLHGGDSRGDQILDALATAGLMDGDGRFVVDVMLVPHLGSRNNVTTDFFRRVKAGEYLFTGDGTFGNPGRDVLKMILDARKGESSVLSFVNRDGKASYGEALDAFFNEHPSDQYGYRRTFRFSGRSAFVIDLLDRVRY